MLGWGVQKRNWANHGGDLWGEARGLQTGCRTCLSISLDTMFQCLTERLSCESVKELCRDKEGKNISKATMGGSKWEEITCKGGQEMEWPEWLRPERKDPRLQARESEHFVMNSAQASTWRGWYLEWIGWRNRHCTKSHMTKKAGKTRKMPETWNLLWRFELTGAGELK